MTRQGTLIVKQLQVFFLSSLNKFLYDFAAKPLLSLNRQISAQYFTFYLLFPICYQACYYYLP